MTTYQASQLYILNNRLTQPLFPTHTVVTGQLHAQLTCIFPPASPTDDLRASCIFQSVMWAKKQLDRTLSGPLVRIQDQKALAVPSYWSFSLNSIFLRVFTMLSSKGSCLLYYMQKILEILVTTDHPLYLATMLLHMLFINYQVKLQQELELGVEEV